MDVKKFVEEQGLSNFPVGLTGCRVCNLNFDSCGYDVVVFDEKLEQDQIIKYEDSYVIHPSCVFI